MVGINPAHEKALIKSKMARDERVAKQAKLLDSENYFKRVLRKLKQKPSENIDLENSSSILNQNEEIDSLKYMPNLVIKHIIIDCSCVNFIDSQGVNGIFQVRKK